MSSGDSNKNVNHYYLKIWTNYLGPIITSNNAFEF